MLELEDVNAYYGDSHILHKVSLAVRQGEVICLLGRNGAGKTTTMLTIMGYLHPRPPASATSVSSCPAASSRCCRSPAH